MRRRREEREVDWKQRGKGVPHPHPFPAGMLMDAGLLGLRGGPEPAYGVAATCSSSHRLPTAVRNWYAPHLTDPPHIMRSC